MKTLIKNIDELQKHYEVTKESKEHIILFKNLEITFNLTLPILYIELNYPNKKYEFVNCNFKKSINFTDKNLVKTEQLCSYYFKYCDFNSLDTENVIFSEKIRFHGCKFLKKIIFNNTTFKNLIDFWSSTFCERVIFYKTNFNEVCVLSSATFKENALFTYSKIKDLLILRSCIFQKGLDLSLAIIKGDLLVFDITLGKFKTIKPIEKRGNWLEEFDKITSKDGKIFTNHKRETYRIIKSQLINQKNIIDSNKFSYLESRTLRQEIWRSLKSPKETYAKVESNNEKSSTLIKLCLTFLNWVRLALNYSILTLNRISNRHKTSYALGVLFTLLIGLVFYYLSLIGSDKYYFSLTFDKIIFSDNLNGYFKFMIPTHKFNYLGNEFIEKYANNIAFYISDIIGRIFVGYGIYQTIQAFRKYSK